MRCVNGDRQLIYFLGMDGRLESFCMGCPKWTKKSPGNRKRAHGILVCSAFLHRGNHSVQDSHEQKRDCSELAARPFFADSVSGR